MLVSLVIIILGCLCVYADKTSPKEPYIGEHLTIHIVGHTHDDPGWLITADQYYVQEVQWIFYTMIPILKTNKLRKFTYVEMAYMHRWWEEIDDNLKQDTTDLINNGQLQINLGGWCMNDEANPTASAIIHQMTNGNQFVLNNFGNVGRPRVAWHVDPFGHSWITAGLWAQAGFDAFGIHRIDYLNLEARKLSQNLEFIWNGSSSLGEDGYIFAHILDDGYGSPLSIQFWNGRSWINNDPLLPSYPVNQEQIADEFLVSARERALNYKHHHILIPFGSDFAHQNAYQSYLQMDKLMDYVNNNPVYNATMIYSTLSDYVVAVNKLNLTWRVEQPDFFTYVDQPHAYWSGYFTSRAILKLYVRSRENDLRVAEQYYLFAKNLNFQADYVGGMKNISFLREAIDVCQHHDAVTGTEKQAVADEYMNQLKNGTIRMDDFAVSVVGQFLQKNGNEPKLQRGGISNLLSQLTTGNYIVMVVYNSLAWTVTEYLKVPTNRSDLVVYDTNSNIIPSQINAIATGEQESEYPSKYNLYIHTVMKPLSFETIFIGVETKTNPSNVGIIKPMPKDYALKIGNGGYYSLTFDSTTHRLSQITNNNISQTFNVENQFQQYVSSGGLYGDNFPNSGAYIFRPSQDNRYRLNLQQHYRYTIDNIVFRETIQNTNNPSYGMLTAPHAGRDWSPETFVTSVCGMYYNNNSFSFSYDIVNGLDEGWYQRPHIDFAVFDNNDENYGRGLFANTVTGSEVAKPASSNADVVKVTIIFGNNDFNTVPELLLSVRKTNCNDVGQYVTTIAEVTAKDATIYVKRVEEHTTGWTEEVYIDWVAYDAATREENELRMHGSKMLSISDDIKVVHPFVVELKLPRYSFVPDEPVVLVSLEQINPVVNNDGSNVYYYGFTTYLTTNETYLLNLYPFNGFNRNGNITLKATFWAFERSVLKHNVSRDEEIVNTIIDGSLISEVQQEFKAGYSQTFRLYNTMDRDLAYIDNRVHIGPIDEGREFVTKFKTELNNNNEWFTNQNGLEYVSRKYASWRDERIAGNYFPSTGQTYLKDIDTNIKFSTIVNQGHGVGSVKAGEYELMLQRRCLADDHRGVAEVLNTTSHTEPQIMILMDTNENVADLNRKLYQIQQFSHTYFFGTGLINSISNYVNMYNTSWTAMNSKNINGLSEQIFLMQMRYGYSGNGVGDNYLNTGIIIQLQNMFEKGEGTMSKNVTVDLNSILDNKILNINNSTEMTLTSNIALSELHRLSWNIETDNGNIKTIRNSFSENKRRKLQKINDKNPVINVSPRQIRTFVVNS